MVRERRGGEPFVAKSYRVLRAILSTAVADELVARKRCHIRGASIWDAPECPMVPTAVVTQLADAVVAVDETPTKGDESRLRALCCLQASPACSWRGSDTPPLVPYSSTSMGTAGA